MVTTAGMTRRTISSRLNTGPRGTISSASAAVEIRPSSVDDDAFKSLSVKVRDGPVDEDEDEDSLALFAASASDCALADQLTKVVATIANRPADRSIREVILFRNIGTWSNAAKCSNCSRLHNHSHRNTRAESAVHSTNFNASTTRSPR